MHRNRVRVFFAILTFLAAGMATAFAQDARVKVKVSPSEAYIFVDGQPFHRGGHTVVLPAGQHTIGVYNYGFVPQVQTLTLQSGTNPEIVAALQPVPGMVSGPWGRIQIEGNPHDRSAVFLNGTTPEYFVGHVDEMNNAIMNSQKLIVPVGTYTLNIVNQGETQPFFSQQIEIRPDQRVIVDTAKHENNLTYVPWKHAGSKESRERFKAGTATAAIAVAPVTAAFNVDKTHIKCEEPIHLSWTSAEAADLSIATSPAVAVAPTGERTDILTRTTTYMFQAKGPGGIVNKSVTVFVDPTVQTALKASPEEVRYRRIGDRVINPGNTTMTWTTDNASQASISHDIGAVSLSGERTVAATPTKTSEGPVDEMETYTLIASNNCGGTDKTLAAVHVLGTIEPIPVVPLASVFFPTGYPTEKRPEIGLVKSQQDVLAETVAGFKKYLEYDPTAKIKIVANTDVRATDEYNAALSERRGKIVKDHLMSLGLTENQLEVVAQGETQQLDKATVKTLEENNPNKFGRHNMDALTLAYNRRVDLVLIPKDQMSQQFFPHKVKDARFMESNAWHSTRVIERVSQAPVTTTASAPSGQQ